MDTDDSPGETMQGCTQCDMDVYAAVDLESTTIDQAGDYRRICLDVENGTVFYHA